MDRMSISHPRASALGNAALGVTGVTWASAFPAIRVGLGGLSPWALGLARLLVASVALAALAAVRRTPVPPRALWPRVLLAGLVGQTLYQGFLMTGEVQVPAGTASILIATAPLFSVVAAAVLLREPARGSAPGMVVAFAGAALVGLSLGLGGGAGALVVLLAAACQGAYHVIVKPLAQQIGASGATVWSVWAGAVLGLPALPLLVTDVRTAPVGAVAAVVFLGLVPTALGYLTWSAAVAGTAIARSTAALFLVPVVAVLLAWWWLGERPSPLALAGGALAIAGVVLVRRRAAPVAPSADHLATTTRVPLREG